MIEYIPDKWQVRFLFQLKGSVFPKSVAWALPSTVLAILLHTFVFSREGQLDMSTFAAYNFVLGFLVVFRSQQAYSRFWEAGTIMQRIRGNWFNAMSACSVFCSRKPEHQQKVLQFKHGLFRLASLLYCTALQQIAVLEDEHFEVLDLEGFDEAKLRLLADCPEKTLIILQWMQQLIFQSYQSGVLDVPPPILTRVFQELSVGIVGVTDAQKISDIQFPFPLAQMVSTMLIIAAVLTPAVCATVMVDPVWCAVLNFLTVFCYWSINYISAEIEMPFGDDDNDLPLHQLQRSLNTALLQLLDPDISDCPRFQFDTSALLCPTVPCPTFLTEADQGIQQSAEGPVVSTRLSARKKQDRRAKKRRPKPKAESPAGDPFSRQISGSSADSDAQSEASPSGASEAGSGASSVGTAEGRVAAAPAASLQMTQQTEQIAVATVESKCISPVEIAVADPSLEFTQGLKASELVVDPVNGTKPLQPSAALRQLISCAHMQIEAQVLRPPSVQGQFAGVSKILAHVFLLIEELDRLARGDGSSQFERPSAELPIAELHGGQELVDVRV